MKAQDRVISSVAEAIEAMADENLMHDIRPARSAKGGDETFGLWFRGHERVAYALTPSILRRPQEDLGAYLDEVSLTRHFQTMNPEASPRDSSDFEWLVVMQHYLAPTRLLDWTENLLVALYFAVRDPKLDSTTEDAAIWMLNARRLNYHASATTRMSLLAFPSDPDVIARSCLGRVRGRGEWRDVFVRELNRARFDREEYRQARITDAIQSDKAVRLGANSLNDSMTDPFDLHNFEVVRGRKSEKIDLFSKEVWPTPACLYSRLRMPVAVYAPLSNRRIRSQSGVFTLHGGRLEPKPNQRDFAGAIGLPISIEEIEDGMRKTRLAKWLRIPGNKRGEIRRTLARIGITDASLFPELDYQSKHLVSRWTYRKEDPEDAA
jgi:hypothetical protein